MAFLRRFGVSVLLAVLLSGMPFSVFARSSYTARPAPWEALKAVACFELKGISGCPAKPAVATCNKWSVCPVTNRLGRRYIVESNGPGSKPPGCDCQPIFRAQFGPASVRIGGTTKNGDRAQAKVVYDMGKTDGPARETFVAVKKKSGWKVSDIYCTGKPQTTIFHSPLAPCYKNP